MIKIISKEQAQQKFMNGYTVLCGCNSKKYGGAFYSPDTFRDVLKPLYSADKKVAFSAFVALTRQQIPHTQLKFAMYI